MEHVQQVFKISVPSDTANLAMIRDFVERAARRSPIQSTDLDKLKLAVDEACSNVIEHAYGKDTTKELTIRVAFDAAQIEVEVIDTGHSYDPTGHTPKTLEELAAHRHDGGMGIRLMRIATDELSWSLDESGHNRLRLVKHLVPPSAT